MFVETALCRLSCQFRAQPTVALQQSSPVVKSPNRITVSSRLSAALQLFG